MDELVSKKGNIYIIGCLLRPGTLKFATELEHTYFPPDTDRNDFYNIFRISYCNMPYYIIEIPSHSLEIVKKLANSLDLNVINGKPYNNEQGSFRLACNAESCFTLETKSYENMGNWQEILKKEQQEVCLKMKNIGNN